MKLQDNAIDMDTPVFYYNGSLHRETDGPVSASSRAVHYGDGVFETMRSRNGLIFRLESHLERLRAGLHVLRIPLPDRGRLRAAVRDVLQANALPEASVKILAFRDGPPGPTPAATHEPCVLITAAPFDPEALRSCAAGVSARTASIRRDETSPLSAIKSLNYLDSIIARMEAADHGDREALLLNCQGRVAEGAASNVFALQGGRLLTPLPAEGALPGITRRTVLEIAHTLGIPCDEAALTPEELKRAGEAFLTNAGAGIMPLTMLDGHPVGAGTPGPVTLRCQEAYDQLFARETEQSA